MNTLLPTVLLLILTFACSAAETSETGRRLREQERQIEQLEVENSRLRWLLQHRDSEAVSDPLYGVSGASDSGQENPRGRIHTVMKGESLSKIARITGSSSEELAILNDLRNPELIRVGQILRVPEIKKSPAIPSKPATKPPSKPSFHVVKAGENLYRIAIRHGVSLEDLLSSNPGIEPHELRVGQKVKIVNTSAQASEARHDDQAPVS